MSAHDLHGCRVYWGHCGCDLYRGHDGDHMGFHDWNGKITVHSATPDAKYLFGEDSPQDGRDRGGS
jgi:hypothetical protein